MKCLILGGLIFLSGCATKKELVYIPTKCDADMPQAPIYKRGHNEASAVVEILQYTEKLEKTLEFCIGN